MKRWLGALAMVVIIAIGVWALRSPQGGPAASPRLDSAPTGEPAPSDVHRTSAESKSKRPPTRAKRVSKDEHAALRRRIAERLQAKPEAAQPTAGDARRTPAPQPAKGSELRDRSDGALLKFMGTLNEDFMPLADECFEQARETTPDLQGLLDLEFSIIADEELGGLVDEVGLGKENEIEDAPLTECIRETMLSTVFPAPEGTGQAKVRLTIPVEPQPPGATG